MSGPNILGGGANILSMANSLLDNGRAIFQRNGGPGLSANSRQMLESFYSNGSALFNQLYARTENAELTNVTQIMALRAKNKSLVSENAPGTDNGAASASSTKGTNLDTSA